MLIHQPRRVTRRVLLLLVSAAAFGAYFIGYNIAFAQEGYPLDGTWRGEWGAAGHKQTMVTVVLNWDGTKINGIIDPGPDSMKITKAALDPSNWSVHIEAAPNAGGTTVVIDCVLDRIGSYHRVLDGTWAVGGAKYPFRVVRQ